MRWIEFEDISGNKYLGPAADPIPFPDTYFNPPEPVPFIQPPEPNPERPPAPPKQAPAPKKIRKKPRQVPPKVTSQPHYRCLEQIQENGYLRGYWFSVWLDTPLDSAGYGEFANTSSSYFDHPASLSELPRESRGILEYTPFSELRPIASALHRKSELVDDDDDDA